jgi:hypothetical protein
MLNRCKNKRQTSYRYYGGKGIKVCNRWRDYVNFKDDVYGSYVDHVKIHGEEDTTIDRIDNSKGYMPDNVRWATRKQQVMNRM